MTKFYLSGVRKIFLICLSFAFLMCTKGPTTTNSRRASHDVAGVGKNGDVPTVPSEAGSVGATLKRSQLSGKKLKAVPMESL